MEQKTGFSSIRTEQEAYGVNFLVDGKIMRLDCMDITHIEQAAGITTIYTRSKQYRADYRVPELLNRLPEDQFMRISRNFIVGLSHVDRVENYIVTVGRCRLQVNYFYRSRLLEALKKVEPKAVVEIKKYNT